MKIRLTENSMPETTMSITSREGLRAASIRPDLFVARHVEETEPRSAAGLRPGRRDSVDTGGGSRAARVSAARDPPPVSTESRRPGRRPAALRGSVSST